MLRLTGQCLVGQAVGRLKGRLCHVALFELDEAQTVTVQALRHRRENDWRPVKNLKTQAVSAGRGETSFAAQAGPSGR